MHHEKVQITNAQADGYILELGPVNLVNAVTRRGMVACGAFDVAALDRFDYPAARVKSARGDPIATIEDLLSGVVDEVNAAAVKCGVVVGMSGREALERM